MDPRIMSGVRDGERMGAIRAVEVGGAARGGGSDQRKAGKGEISSTRAIGAGDLLFWAQTLLEEEDDLSIDMCRDGILMGRILAKVVDPRSGRALDGVMNKNAQTRDDRLENIALVCTVMREGGEEGWDGDVEDVEDGDEGAVVGLLMAMYRLYFKNCTTQACPHSLSSLPGDLHGVPDAPSCSLTALSSPSLPSPNIPPQTPNP